MNTIAFFSFNTTFLKPFEIDWFLKIECNHLYVSKLRTKLQKHGNHTVSIVNRVE